MSEESPDPPSPPDEHYYSLHVCGPTRDGDIRVKTSGYEGDFHYTGQEEVPPDSPDIGLWRWLHENRRAFPPIIPQNLFPGIALRFRAGPPAVRVPPNGFYFISATWSGPAVAARMALESAHARRPLPRPLYILDTDSPEPSEQFPQLMGLLHGWGEVFGFIDGHCDLYLALGKDLTMFERMIGFLYRRGEP
jgi:hypothetical protein